MRYERARHNTARDASGHFVTSCDVRERAIHTTAGKRQIQMNSLHFQDTLIVRPISRTHSLFRQSGDEGHADRIGPAQAWYATATRLAIGAPVRAPPSRSLTALQVLR